MSNAVRVLCLDDDNHSPSYHAEDTFHWNNANQFIKHLTHSYTPYEVRQVNLVDFDVDNPDIDPDTIFNIVDCNGRGYSFEEYQEAFNILWEHSEPI